MINIHGVRGSVPNSSQHTLRYGGNTPCVEVKTAKYQLIFDCGSGFSKIDFTNDLQTILNDVGRFWTTLDDLICF